MSSQSTDRPDDADADANPKNKNKRGAGYMFHTVTVNTPEIGEARISMTDEGIVIESDADADWLGEFAQNIFGAFSNDSKPNGIPLSTEFYVYENTSTNRARVHKADCGFCNHGEGRRSRRKAKSPVGGSVRWHGPCDTREAAFAAMERLGKKDIGACSACNP